MSQKRIKKDHGGNFSTTSSRQQNESPTRSSSSRPRKSPKRQKDQKRPNREGQTRMVSVDRTHFSIGEVVPHLTCTLCKGIFREPMTNTECLHTFCKACLDGQQKCPLCDINLGRGPYYSFTPDRALQDLIERHLFPQWKRQDEKAEQKFYAERNIELKAEFRDNGIAGSPRASASRPRNLKVCHDEMEFRLLPVNDEATLEHKVPRWNKCSGKIKMAGIKKFILGKLFGEELLPSSIELFCCGKLLGDEWTLAFVDRTIWRDTEAPVVLTYRCSKHVND